MCQILIFKIVRAISAAIVETDKTMKFGWHVPYTKTIKKSKGDNQTTVVHRPLGQKNKKSIDCKCVVLSGKCKNHMLEINKN